MRVTRVTRSAPGRRAAAGPSAGPPRPPRPGRRWPGTRPPHRERAADVVVPEQHLRRPRRPEDRILGYSCTQPAQAAGTRVRADGPDVVVPGHEVDERIPVRRDGHLVEAVRRQHIAGPQHDHQGARRLLDGGIRGRDDRSAIGGGVLHATVRRLCRGGGDDRGGPGRPALQLQGAHRPVNRVAAVPAVRRRGREHHERQRHEVGQALRLLALIRQLLRAGRMAAQPGAVRRLPRLDDTGDAPHAPQPPGEAVELAVGRQPCLRDLTSSTALRQPCLGKCPDARLEGLRCRRVGGAPVPDPPSAPGPGSPTAVGAAPGATSGTSFGTEVDELTIRLLDLGITC